MGSYLSGIAPAQILSTESYFTELPEFQFESSLGSTRFLKVARAKHKEGHVVIKVFVIHDLSLPLKSYQEELDRIRNNVSLFPNVLPFKRTMLTDRAGLLIRQYVHDNLYDRISTRPFLNTVEKKWIIFQVLCALEQMHSAKVCHGDIKTENILVTSWSWVLLADLASFKPVYVPADNPADFNFFFDTSRRRMCYLAPERFVDAHVYADASTVAPTPSDDDTTNASAAPASTATSPSAVGGGGKVDGGTVGQVLPLVGFPTAHHGELTEAMDIFSVGCVTGELFCEGTGLFDLSQLLAYRTGDYNPEPKLSKVDDHINDMIKHMIQVEPSKRLTAKEYMTKYRGRVFPEEFYSFLKTYLSEFVGPPVLTSDEKIAKLSHDLDRIKNALSHVDNSLIEHSEEENQRQEVPESDNCFVVIVSLVTSCVRSLKFCTSKLTALDLMLDLSHYVPDDIILELLLPYMFYLVNDHIPRVRAKSITTITRCVQIVTVLPKNEANIFPEYILPNLSHLANDTEVVVQCAFAENISHIAETALRFLELAQLGSYSDAGEDQSQYQVSYDVELHALHDLIQSKVVALLTNSQNIVKRTLMENGVMRLCSFFGRQKAKDILLLHIITFLNDKQDWQLRATFFDSIVGVAVYIGHQCMTILKPLLQQGMKDPEEYVVTRTLYALKSLVELELLQKPIIYKFIEDVVPFLAHPSLWIRYGATGYVIACAKNLSLADIHCILMPILRPFLREPLIQIDNQTILLSVLESPIPRAIYDYIIRSKHGKLFLDRLEKHHDENKNATIPFSPPQPDLAQVARKLKSQGLTVPIEKKIILLQEIILYLNQQTFNPDNQQSQELKFQGLLDVSGCQHSPESRSIDLTRTIDRTSDKSEHPTLTKRSSQMKVIPTPQSLSEQLESPRVDEHGGAGAATVARKDDDAKTAAIQTTLDLEHGQPAPQPITLGSPSDGRKYPQCKHDITRLEAFKRNHYASDMKRRLLLSSVAESRGDNCGWKPEGQLVAHLHEHTGGINRVVVSDDCSYFATASDDSTVRIWDTSRLEHKALTSRSKFTYRKQVGKINCVAFVNPTTLACSSSEDASIHVFRVDSSAQGNKLPILIEKKLNAKEEGCAVDMHQYDTGNQSIVTYATVHGYLCGWDLRQPKERYAWKLKNDVRLGLVTSFAVDSTQCWLTCGTSDGALVCWDMRFQLPITQIIHPRKARVRRVGCHPLESSWVVASYHGSNEVSMWDLETSAKRQTLWASQYPPLSLSQVSHETVLAMYSSTIDGKPYFITAGSDRRIRYWNLDNPEASAIVAGSSTDNLEHITLNYTSRMIDGTDVLYETYEKRRSNMSYDERPRRGPDEPPIGHHDSISDIAVTKVPQNFLISASKDGVVKVWK